MKLYINHDSQPQGPYSVDEIQDKIYSGEMPRSAQARIEGSMDWQPLESLLKSQQPTAKPPELEPAASVIELLRDPKEKMTLIWLYIASIPMWLFLIIFIVASMGVPLIFIGLFWLIRAVGEMMFVAYLKTNAVRVSEQQLPELLRVAQSGARKLGMDCPEVYVMQQNVWNAFAAKIFGQRMVVLLSGAVDSILLKGDEQQLAWLVGHELGHHWAGHLNLSQKLAKLGNVILWLGLWHSRRAELTCDRVGLYCAGSLRASQLALINATVGAQLANRVNAEAAIAQWQQHQGEFFVRYRTLYSSHPHLLARLDHLTQTATEFGMKA